MVTREVRREADGISSFRFERADGGALQAWEPGAHLDFTLPSGLTRQYSLCGDPADDHSYLVAVLDQPEGRGGSREFHSSIAPGATIEVRGPRNHFPLVDAESYLFIAGGIGITPILPMARAVAAAGKRWRVVYGGRTTESMAFLEELRQLRGDTDFVPESSRGRIDIAGALADAPAGTQVYCCGPEPLLRAVEECCANHANVGAVHFERFGSARLPGDSTRRTDDAGAPSGLARFEVELASTGTTVVVDEGESILDRVLEVVPGWPWACREGYCGSCEARVVEGEPEHQDDVLTDEERASNAVMMICVGRSCSPRLVLDI
ncbi:putative oxidoreductase [Rhodococcus wratislaviensis NBRC 100605]|uniref:Putative oxidoreductase n=1 Tax=Rhodococcus wratislaviensis NBRC 100605 TaxID=1219028 RepID=X0Q1R5_RHOWR|nr:putative oxidoreductase [Rhodococcus wratislaviensis NBRC 100605]